MNKILTAIAICILAVLLNSPSYGQGMAVNTSGAAANSSAILDVASTTQGMLAPRMTSTQRGMISSPATGLLVYQTDAPAGFYMYNGGAWVMVLSGASSAGGDLTGTYPNPTVAATSSAGKHVIAAINADTDVINTANLGRGTASSSKYLRGDATWNTPVSNYIITMGSGSAMLRLTTTTTGTTDSIDFLGLGVAGNQMVNVNAGSYIDPSGTVPLVAVPLPSGGTVTTFSFYFRNESPSFIILTGTYTFYAQLYYSTPYPYSLIGSETFYPVTGAGITLNMNTVTGGLMVPNETMDGTVTGLSTSIPAGARLLVMVYYNVSTSPFAVQPLAGYATATIGMQQ